MLNYLNTHPEVYTHLENITARICEGFEKNLKELGIKGTVNRIGSMFTLFFTDQKVKDFESAKTSDTALFGRYFRAMLEAGVYLAPSQYESLFISTAITEELAEEIIKANYKALKAVFQNA